MEASRALAIVLRELESPALTEARAKLAQVESDAATKIAALQEQLDELHGQYTICNACARMAQARADDKVKSIAAHYESIVDDLWLGNKSLNMQNDSLRERIRELMDGNKGAVRKNAARSGRRRTVKESTRLQTKAQRHGSVSGIVRSPTRT